MAFAITSSSQSTMEFDGRVRHNSAELSTLPDRLFVAYSVEKLGREYFEAVATL